MNSLPPTKRSLAAEPGATARQVLSLGHLRFLVIAAGSGALLGALSIAIPAAPPTWVPLIVLALLCPFLMMIARSARKVLLAALMIDIPLQWDTHLGFRPDAARLGALGGLNLSITTTALAGLYALWVADLLARPQAYTRPLVRSSLPLALYLIVMALSALVARDPGLAAFQIFLFAQMFLLYTYIASTIRTRQDVLFLIAMLLFGLLLEGVIVGALRSSDTGVSVAGITGRIDRAGPQTSSRFGGTIGSPNAAAAYLSLLLAPALSLLFAQIHRWYRALALVAFSLGTAALILTLSRGGWTAFMLSITVLCLLAWRSGWLSLWFLCVVGTILLVLGLLFGPLLWARLLDSDQGAAYARIPLIWLALRISADNLVLGVGANNFAVVIPQYATPEFGQTWLYTVHNRYLLVLAETGIAGLLTFIWFLGATFWHGWRCRLSRHPLYAPFASGVIASLTGALAHMSVEIYHNRPLVQLMWLLAALLATTHAMVEQAEGAPNAESQPTRSHRLGVRQSGVL